MNIGNKILFLLDQNNMKQKELAALIKISPSTLSDLLNGKTKKLDVQKAKEISKILGCSLDYLLDDDCIDNQNVFSFSPIEMEIITKYRLIDEIGKEVVNGGLNAEYKRYLQAQSLEKERLIIANKVKENTTPYIYEPEDRVYPEGVIPVDRHQIDDEDDSRITMPVYDLGASAGTGVFLDNPCYEMVAMPEDRLSRKASFALWVSGNSMEPRFHNGDLVLVKIQPTVEIGEIGIFILNGEGYIKKWGGDKLISLNQEYEPIEIGENDTLYCKGKVIGNA